MKVKLGDLVVRKLDFSYAPENGNARIAQRRYTGTVVYVHPKGRFFVAEFLFGDKDRIRVSFREVES